MPRPITLSPAELSLAWHVAGLRQLQSRNGKDRHAAARVSTELGHGRAVMGAIGELAAARALKMCWPATVGAPKSDPDIFPDVQVRTRAQMTHDLLVREDDPPGHRYVLVLAEWPVMHVYGWLWHAEILRLGEYRPEGLWPGDSPLWLAAQSILRPL